MVAKVAEMNNTRLNEEDLEMLGKNMDIHVHLTKDEYAKPTAEEGLQPGKDSGVGLPDSGHNQHMIYALIGSSDSITRHVSTEAVLRNVIMFARKRSLTRTGM